jgi:hypothetical protein
VLLRQVAHSNHLLGNLLYYQRKQYDAAGRLYQRALDVRVQYGIWDRAVM